MKHNFKYNRKAFTLIELLIVIAIIGILFIVLVSKVDFATDKAKTTGVQTDFRSFQVAFETVSRENSGFNTLGWDTGDNAGGIAKDGPVTIGSVNYTYANAEKDAGDRVRNSYDVGDLNLNGKQDASETWTGRKIYTETWSGIYILDNPADATDMSAYIALETAINKNLDPKLHLTIDPENKTFNMKNGYQDPWTTEYHGFYLSNASVDGKDRGAIVMYSDGPNKVFGSEQTIANGVVVVTVKNGGINGQDDLSIITCYTYYNGYGEIKTNTSGFSNNQGNINGEQFSEPETPDEPEVTEVDGGLYRTGSNYTEIIYSWEELLHNGSLVVEEGKLNVGLVYPDNANECNDYGFYFNIPYMTYYEDYSYGYIFYEDGTARYIDNGYISDTSQTVIYSDSQIYFVDMDYTLLVSGGGDEIIEKWSDQWGSYEEHYTIKQLPTLSGDLKLPNDNSITSISPNAFTGTNITGIIFADSITYIGTKAFYIDSLSMDTLKLPDNLTTLGGNAFIYDNFKNIIISGNYIYDENNSDAYIELQQDFSTINNVENNSPNVYIYGNIDIYTVGVNGNIRRPEFGDVKEIVYKGTVEQFVQRWVDEHLANSYGYRQGADDAIVCSNGIVAVSADKIWEVNGIIEGVTDVTILSSYGFLASDNEPFYFPSTLKKLHSSIFSEIWNQDYSDFIYNGTIEQWLAIEKAPDWAPDTDWVITCTDGTVAFDGTITYN